jgi:4-hydroxy-tetrahydrodipicolinate reductase
MKIAIIGYGRMGKSIETLSVEYGHEVVHIFGGENIEEFTVENLKKADVAIDFSLPHTAFTNITTCIKAGVPVVSGTTGWLDRYDEVKAFCLQENGAFFYASNFSIGVNIFMEINERLAELMNTQDAYDVSITEIHHTRKLDAPSGTAITLAEAIINRVERKSDYSLGQSQDKVNIHIDAIRKGDVPGTHIIEYKSDIDTLEIKHVADSRIGFAKGAILAAEWLIGKKGVLGMRDMLKSR